MTKKDISVNLYQECLILRSEILLNVLRNKRLTILLPCQYMRFQPYIVPNIKAFLATFGVSFSYLQMVPHMYDLASIYVSLTSVWPCLTLFFRAESH